jgi:NAD(P)-dependent dehydrogenase (short-subunit alcohol dehydrogenase family)
MEIAGSVILITGAAARVGREVALYLASRGANIAFSYFLPDEPWQQTLSEIEACGVKALAQQLEVRDRSQVHAFVDTALNTFGQIDVLINNASVWLKAPFLDISESDWDMAMDVNLKGPFLASQAVAPHMLERRQGVILNITDLSAFQVWPNYAHHAASKAGLATLTKYLAVELAPFVRVNAIAPGTVLLPDNPSPEKIKWATEKSLLGRVGSPQDVARLAEFLITNEFVTGSVNFVDGGRNLI